ncbi:hypothetical protein FH972_024288 [Carpinus fangiana]|uniref:NAD-dependent epimerase/dehydratase domain-containing protein n=1 Tax=Carpinus fangiana TaxID=176857 RepID=A0A5N6KXM6_9ROSI|nr:hypothetical protein FH972_024288 [Carpinus fangiana]
MASKQNLGRLFVIGGSGYVGSVITELAVAQGYDVHGLSRTENSDEKLRSLGATAVRGDLTSVDVLRQESSEADVVIHLATAFTMGVGTYDDTKHIDIAAVDAIADGLAGTNKPLIVTNGTLVVEADPTGAETTEKSPLAVSPVSGRGEVEQYSLALASRGIRVMVVRLAPYVYGRGGSGVGRFIGMAAKTGKVTCVDAGRNHTTTVHVDDVASLYLLAAQKGKAGEVYNATTATNLTARQIFDAIAAAVGVSVQDIAHDDAVKHIGVTFAWFLRAENRASGAKAVKELGWQPEGDGILEEISGGSYHTLAQSLRQTSAK